jgi:hypothetical protein
MPKNGPHPRPFPRMAGGGVTLCNAPTNAQTEWHDLTINLPSPRMVGGGAGVGAVPLVG